MVIEGDAVPQHFIPQLISLFERGLSPFDKLIQTYDLDQINTAFKGQRFRPDDQTRDRVLITWTNPRRAGRRRGL